MFRNRFIGIREQVHQCSETGSPVFRNRFTKVQEQVHKRSGTGSQVSRNSFISVQEHVHERSGIKFTSVQEQVHKCSGTGSQVFRNRFTSVQEHVQCSGTGSSVFRNSLTNVQEQVHERSGTGSSVFRNRFTSVQEQVHQCSGTGSRTFRNRFISVQEQVHQCSGTGSPVFRNRFTSVQEQVHQCSGSGSRTGSPVFRNRFISVQEQVHQCSGTEDSVSNISSRHGSKTSSRRSRSSSVRSSAVSDARAMAAAKKAILGAEAATLQRLHQIEEEELRLRQRKKELKLQTEMAKADAEELAYAQAEQRETAGNTRSAFLEEGYKLRCTVPPPMVEDTQGSPAAVVPDAAPRRPLDPPKDESTAIKPQPHMYGPRPPMVDNPLILCPQVSETPLRSQHTKSTNAHKWKYDTSQQPSQNPSASNTRYASTLPLALQHPPYQTNDYMQQMMLQQQEAIMSLTLPQPDLPVFSGDPVEYCDFIRAFENLIERKTRNPSSRLYYLLQYTAGQVQDLVRSCLAMREETGYTEARKLLAERYGQPYKIATAYVDHVINGQPIRAEDGPALQKFSILLTSCNNTLKEIGYLSRLENPESLRKIVDRLPYSLKLKWREAADSITQKGKRDPTLKDMTEFVEARSRVANHPIFGCTKKHSTFLHDKEQKETQPKASHVNTTDANNGASNTVNAMGQDKKVLTSSLPVSTDTIGTQEDVDRWPHLKGIKIPSIEAEIGLLIGSDAPQILQPKEVRESENGGPYATQTVLGWVLNGPLGREKNKAATANFVDSDTELSKQFREYCNLEFNDSTYEPKTSMSQNDRRALEIMQTTTVKLEDNHYEIALPWKNDPPCLYDNKSQAERRLQLLKKRLQKDPVVLEKYKDFMDNLLSKNHARKLSSEDLAQTAEAWYLPHHPVFHPQKPGKVRVVFDCSAKYRGSSLNDQLLQGPDLTNTLIGVLTRFRQEQVAFMSDIEAMFYQVRVRPSDCKYLRFLWWPDGNMEREPQEYQMSVHLFGGASSPSCANYALKKTAEDNKDYFDHETVQTVKGNFYVDDCLRSIATEPEAVRLEVIDSVPASERAASVKDLDFDNAVLTERALGVQWNVHVDTFSYKIASKEKPATRRGILSIGLGWDDKIPEYDKQRWESWLSDLPKLEQFSIPRCFKPPDFTDVQRRELHHFSDASSHGYGAVSYLRQIDASDSTCVLRYIENKDKRFQTFVANRVAAILDQSTETQWKYVETSLNPADEASRGMTVDAFLHNKRWTDGPDFLKQSEETWPQRPPDMGQIPNDDPEVKKTIEVFAIEVSNDSDYISKVLEKFSSWTRLKKIIAWILRYKNNLRKQSQRQRVIVKYVRKQAFKEELSILNCIDKENQESSNQSTVKKCSSIYKLDPIMTDSLLRKYWIIAARSSVRNAVNTCFDCRRRQAPVMQQKMASLPQNRTTPCKPPFTRGQPDEIRSDNGGLNTLMCEVESIVNGRPITKVSDDPKDLDALTPNHLLLLRAGTATPPGVFSKDDNYTRRRWRQVQYLSNLFWLRWTKEYLPSLQQRQKWNKPLEI
ncbi:hypothetical protein QZH41_000763 [Actinostola sp. cb2023]|nr:hypothetical protein QZH41_000763 [Actinostola sp. cb2023]